jgi:formylmethanofuran dehydrogenase subunit E
MCDRAVVKLVELESIKRFEGHRSGRAVYGIILHSLALRDCGFESHGGRGCLTLVGVVCCKVEVSAAG